MTRSIIKYSINYHFGAFRYSHYSKITINYHNLRPTELINWFIFLKKQIVSINSYLVSTQPLNYPVPLTTRVDQL
jgi:hypothetical protein